MGTGLLIGVTLSEAIEHVGRAPHGVVLWGVTLYFSTPRALRVRKGVRHGPALLIFLTNVVIFRFIDILLTI